MKNEIIRVGQIEVKFLLEAADTNGSVSMFEFTVLVGAKMPLPHSHKHYEENRWTLTRGNLVLFRAGLFMGSTT